MNETTAVYLVIISVPASLLLLTWQRVWTRRDALAISSTVTVKLPLLITTGSCLLFFLVFRPATGVHYSDVKFAMIVTALGVSLAMVILSFVGKRPLGWLMPLTSAAVTVAWLYLWAMSAAV